MQSINTDKVKIKFVRNSSGIFPGHKLLRAGLAHIVIGRGDQACVIGDVAAHPDHQVLIVALIKKKQIVGLGLIHVPADELAVVLNQLDSVDVGADLVIALILGLCKLTLRVSQIQFRRQIAI